MSNGAETLIPTTMVGSYPRPRWYTRRLWGKDIREALTEQNWREEYEDAVKAVIKDQELAGLDIVSDGEMFEDDLVGGFGWPDYPLSHLGGIDGRADSPLAGVVEQTAILTHMMASAPTPVVTQKVTRGPLRFAYLYQLASSLTHQPVKASFADPQFVVGSGLNDRYYGGKPGQPSQELVLDLVSIYNQELRELADGGCPIYQSDLPPFAELAKADVPGAAWEFDVKAFNTMVEGTGTMQIWQHY